LLDLVWPTDLINDSPRCLTEKRIVRRIESLSKQPQRRVGWHSLRAAAPRFPQLPEKLLHVFLGETKFYRNVPQELLAMLG
jgi:hypothetical protein